MLLRDFHGSGTLPAADKTKMNFGSDAALKAWKDIWGAGQGVGNIHEVLPVRELVGRPRAEYAAACRRLAIA
jgi:nitronate monooxygenase